MELVSLRCNRDFTSASSYGLGWYKYAIATQWYQFHTTDAWWFSLNPASTWSKMSGISYRVSLISPQTETTVCFLPFILHYAQLRNSFSINQCWLRQCLTTKQATNYHFPNLQKCWYIKTLVSETDIYGKAKGVKNGCSWGDERHAGLCFGRRPSDKSRCLR